MFEGNFSVKTSKLSLLVSLMGRHFIEAVIYLHWSDMCIVGWDLDTKIIYHSHCSTSICLILQLQYYVKHCTHTCFSPGESMGFFRVNKNQ